jgi:hypothetical protein
MDDRLKLSKALITELECNFNADSFRKFLASYTPPQFLKLEPTSQGVANYCFELCQFHTSLPPKETINEVACKRLGGIRKQLKSSLSIIKNAQGISDQFGIEGSKDPVPLSQEEVMGAESIIKKAIRWYEELEEMNLNYARDDLPVAKKHGRPSKEDRNNLEIELCDLLIASGLIQHKVAIYIKQFLAI